MKKIERQTVLSTKQYMDVINEVMDPELGIGIVDLGLIYKVEELPKGIVKVTMTLTSMACPAGPQITSKIEEVLEALPHVKTALIEIIWDPPWDPGKMNPEIRTILYGNRTIENETGKNHREG